MSSKARLKQAIRRRIVCNRSALLAMTAVTMLTWLVLASMCIVLPFSAPSHRRSALAEDSCLVSLRLASLRLHRATLLGGSFGSCHGSTFDLAEIRKLDPALRRRDWDLRTERLLCSDTLCAAVSSFLCLLALSLGLLLVPGLVLLGCFGTRAAFARATLAVHPSALTREARDGGLRREDIGRVLASSGLVRNRDRSRLGAA